MSPARFLCAKTLADLLARRGAARAPRSAIQLTDTVFTHPRWGLATTPAVLGAPAWSDPRRLALRLADTERCAVILDVQLGGLPFAASIDWDATGLALHGGARPLALVTSRKQNQATSFRLQSLFGSLMTRERLHGLLGERFPAGHACLCGAADDQLHYFMCPRRVNERAQVLDQLRSDVAKAARDLFADVRPGERPLGLRDLADRFARYLLPHDPGPLHLRRLAATAITRADLAKWKKLFPPRAVPVPARAAADQVAPPLRPKVPTPRAALVRIMDVVSTVIQSELRLPHVRDLVEDAPPRPRAPLRHDRELRAAHAPGQIAVIRRCRRAPRYSVAPRCVQCGEKETRHVRPVCEARLAARRRVADILRGADSSNLLGWSGGGG